MAVASGAIKSTLNPNAPLFVPAAFQRVEDYSPEWWELVKTTSWFRDYWFHEHQQQENIFDASHQFVDYDNDDVVVADDDNDIANLLPESLDLGILEDEAFHQTISLTHNSGLKSEADKWIRDLSLNSPKTKGIRSANKQWEKPIQPFSPRARTLRVIHQPR